ncbi:hypothetical protein MESS2_1570011 [Mesorhizobium metallidurans STM 2683]|uniref:Uncharacterized protein n=1 Tax=Mesorhizobium metallidurans STM 2683 TaxID=1297569 RepID=M5F0R7_9HYPH|nr:hypothetical protein MESS2_1570011 [Mesorhizobium metallidurans STM 2683]
MGRCIGSRKGLVAVGRTVLASGCYGLSMPLKDVPFALGRSPAERGVVGLVDMLEVGLKVQPMLPQNVAVEVLAECSLDHSRLHRINPVGFASKDFSSRHVGVNNELLLGLAVSVPEAVKALVGHAHKLGMLLLFLLFIGQLLNVVYLVIHGRQLRGQSPFVTLGLRGYLKDFGAA